MKLRNLRGTAAALTAFFIMPAFSSAATGAEVPVKAPEPAKDAPRKPVNVASDRMETDRAENIVIFSGNVAAEEDFILCSDELRVSYDESKEIREIKANGNVRILRDGKTAASDGALYDRKARTILLTGRAVVTQCSDSVKGDRITFYVDSNRALIEGEKGGRVKAAIMSQKKCQEDEKAPPQAQSAEAWCKSHPSLSR